MVFFYVYILECKDKKGRITYYTGSTLDLIRRFEEHRSGKGAKYTRGKKLRLVYFERFFSNSEARRRENEIKKLPLSEKKKLIKSSQ
ncbi:MAG: GIY-YIG nuclease family protein [Promethearchaeota archaeon]